MALFNIQPIARFNGSSTAIRRPKEIACFSYDEQHRFFLDERSLRYYYPPTLGADLSRGFDSFEHLDDTTDDHLDGLLKSVIDLEQRNGLRCQADIITWRGMMTKILTTPFETFDGFEMNATKFQGTIFIEENHKYKLVSRMSQHSQPSQNGAPSQDLMSYWGYKFETLSLIPNHWDSTPREFIEKRGELTVNNYAQYCSVVKTGIGKTKLIIGGEVDALWDCKPDHKDDPINWVELKTSAEIECDKDEFRYEKKLLKFWAQSFLLGVPKIIVGFRNKNGILQRIEDLETKNIPLMIKKRRKQSWDGNLCINFASNFLEWLKATITSEGVWRITRKASTPIIEAFKIEESGQGDILSLEFTQWRNRVPISEGVQTASLEQDVQLAT